MWFLNTEAWLPVLERLTVPGTRSSCCCQAFCRFHGVTAHSLLRQRLALQPSLNTDDMGSHTDSCSLTHTLTHIHTNAVKWRWVDPGDLSDQWSCYIIRFCGAVERVFGSLPFIFFNPQLCWFLALMFVIVHLLLCW